MTKTVVSAYEKNFKIAVKFAATEKIRPALTGVYHSEQHELIATDGLALIIIEDGFDHPNLIGKLYNKKNEIVEARYPDVSRIIPHDVKTLIEGVDVKEWIAAHETAYKVVQKHETNPVQLSVSPTIKLRYEKGSETADLSTGRMKGDDVTIGYNCKFMVKALKAIRQLGHKAFDIGFNGHNQPMKLTAPGVTVVISPLLFC